MHKRIPLSLVFLILLAETGLGQTQVNNKKYSFDWPSIGEVEIKPTLPSPRVRILDFRLNKDEVGHVTQGTGTNLRAANYELPFEEAMQQIVANLVQVPKDESDSLALRVWNYRIWESSSGGIVHAYYLFKADLYLLRNQKYHMLASIDRVNSEERTDGFVKNAGVLKRNLTSLSDSWDKFASKARLTLSDLPNQSFTQIELVKEVTEKRSIPASHNTTLPDGIYARLEDFLAAKPNVLQFRVEGTNTAKWKIFFFEKDSESGETKESRAATYYALVKDGKVYILTIGLLNPATKTELGYVIDVSFKSKMSGEKFWKTFSDFTQAAGGGASYSTSLFQNRSQYRNLCFVADARLDSKLKYLLDLESGAALALPEREQTLIR